MRKSFLLPAILTALLAPAAARAEECQDYHRTVDFEDGISRQAEGTACLDDYGVWRVREEHLTPLSAPLPPDVYYVPPRYYPARPYYAYYDDPLYYPYGPYYYGPTVSFGFSYHDHHHHHHH